MFFKMITQDNFVLNVIPSCNEIIDKNFNAEVIGNVFGK